MPGVVLMTLLMLPLAPTTAKNTYNIHCEEGGSKTLNSLVAAFRTEQSSDGASTCLHQNHCQGLA
jgi:hypothetical protein